MLKKVFKSSLGLALTAMILTSCGQNLNVSTNPIDGSNSSVSSDISNLKFTKVPEQKKAEYNNLITKNLPATSNLAQADSSVGSGVAMATPAIAPAALGAPDAVSSKMMAYPGMYFPSGGPFEEYTVVDFEEAKAAGFSGTYLEVLNKIVKPAVKALGTDARMVNSSGNSDANGVNRSNDTQNNQNTQDGREIYPVYDQYQWHFTFVSSSKKEFYNISISSRETLVLKQKWGLRDLKIENIKVDSSEAIKIFTTALKDKTFKLPDDPNVGAQYLGPNGEYIYEIPQNTNWYLNIEQEKGKLVWNVNLNVNVYYPMPEIAPAPGCAVIQGDTAVSNTTTASDVKPTATVVEGSSGGGSSSAGVAAPCYTKPYIPQQPEYSYSGAYARIDSETGKILSFSRLVRYKNNYNYGVPVPMPMPVDLPATSAGSASSSGSVGTATATAEVQKK